MLTCIACPKHLDGGSLRAQEDDEDCTPSTRQAIKALTSQIKDMALKASGAYRHYKPCTGSSAAERRRYDESSELAPGSERFHHYHRRVGGGGRTSSERGRIQGRMVTAFVDEEEDSRHWVAQVEPGILLTFFSLPQGSNELKRIRFSREMYNKWQAQHWWAENHQKVMELYNLEGFNHRAITLPIPPTSEDESSKMESDQESQEMPPLGNGRLPRHFHRPMNDNAVYGMGYSSSDSMDYKQFHCGHCHHHQHISHFCNDSGGLPSTPNLSSVSGAKTEISSADASVKTSSYPNEADQSGEFSASMSYASEQKTEWVEQDDPGVYITIRELSGSIRELRRIRFRSSLCFFFLVSNFIAFMMRPATLILEEDSFSMVCCHR
ncbi:Protein Brevis radix-like 1 [Platanthera zijinensis]|uniref:Protein Brevis radix-like 1 n=1 Tax=Platanthera zijinensis TaxID=2320716 RepID=A0AAP0B0E7_9ASPA